MQPSIDNENVAIVFGSMALFVLFFRIFMFGIPLMKKSFQAHLKKNDKLWI